MGKKRLVVLTGAGISAESGISTFRDSDGLWNEYRVEDVATPEGFYRNPKLVLDFYNDMRKDLKNHQPNYGHIALKELEEDFDVKIITQNVDDLHERAGSSSIIHLHGELMKVCSSKDTSLVTTLPSMESEIHVGDISMPVVYDSSVMSTSTGRWSDASGSLSTVRFFRDLCTRP